jgi:CheY-like chemotaxis protein
MGFNVQTFATAKEFRERARVESPSCLVLDVHLPGPSGLDLARPLAGRLSELSLGTGTHTCSKGQLEHPVACRYVLTMAISEAGGQGQGQPTASGFGD